jgi:hypothetical protein
MPASAVVLINPGRDPPTRGGFARELLAGTQLKLQRAMKRLDDRVVQRLSGQSKIGSAFGPDNVSTTLSPNPSMPP